MLSSIYLKVYHVSYLNYIDNYTVILHAKIIIICEYKI